MCSYEVLESHTVFDGMLSRVRMDEVRMPDGDVREREIVEHAGAVAVVPVDDEGRVVLIRHYRPALRERFVEVPAGMLDVADEAPEHTARRELAEEVGLEAGTVVELTHFVNSGGWSTETTIVYLATDLAEVTGPAYTRTGEEADIEVFRVPLAEAVGMAERGELRDAKTVIGVLLASARLRDHGG